MLNFHYYEQRFQNLFYIRTAKPICRLILLYHVTSSNVHDPQNIWDPQKDCGSFVDQKLRALHRRNLNK